MEKNSRILILADIHGRTFWKNPCSNPEKYSKIIFLGDYVDPYYDDNISREDAIKNFEEIISFKKENADKCILLIGNHDMAYLNSMMPKSRFDRANQKKIESLFTDNIKLFDIAYEDSLDGTRYIFSHSGIMWPWVEDFKEMYEWEYPDMDGVVPFLNNMFHTTDDYASSVLFMVSRYRGGWDRNGSCVWGDFEEFYNYSNNKEKAKIPNSYQIFGHTRLSKRPLVMKDFACLDYSIPIEFEDGKFYMPNGDEIPITVI